jgi:anti-anti-sigma regulatory factor
MGAIDHYTGPDGWYWERVSDGVLRFVPAGDLDYDVRADVEAALATVPPGSAPVIDIDLCSVAFLDASTARLIARYRSAALTLGHQVRIVSAAGMPYQILAVLGVLAPADVCLSGLHRQCSQAVATRFMDVLAMVRSAIGRAREIRSEAEHLRKARRPREGD